MKQEMFKGMLKHVDGRQEMIAIPGVTGPDGTFFVPEHIDFQGKRFLLNKKIKTDEWFEYDESSEKVGRAPFRDDLH